MKVFISYSAKASVEKCFWQYFFQSCGIWTSIKQIENDLKVDLAQTPHLIILDSEDENKILDVPKKNVVYCVKKSSKTKKRSDIIKIRWWSKEFYKDVITILLADKKNRVAIHNLLEIFTGIENGKNGEWLKTEGLWGASWLFHEIGYGMMEEWSEEIQDKCNKSIKKLKRKEREIGDCWNYKYMKLYCEYLKCGVSNKDFFSRLGECKKILEECEELSKKEGWLPTLCVLSGQICNLSVAESRYAVNYYDIAVKYEQQADLLYEIGRIYEKIYSDNEAALYNYYRSYMCDKNYYRALYKLAIDLEQKDKWIDAMGFYNKIQDILKEIKCKDSITIKEIEYKYKTYSKMINLCQKNISDDDVVNSFEKEINEIREHIEDYVDFGKMFNIMFEPQNCKIKMKDLMNILRQKMKNECIN